MIIIPAVDIKDGRCVRLLQGMMDRETVFSNDPAAMAQRWEALGAELIHLVDLNGAVDKKPRNLATIESILAGVKVPLQLGGGIRDMATIENYLAIGVSRIVLGTEAIRNPDFVIQAARAFPERIVVGIDARNGYVAIEGWTETTGTTAIDLARRLSAPPKTLLNGPSKPFPRGRWFVNKSSYSRIDCVSRLGETGTGNTPAQKYWLTKFKP